MGWVLARCRQGRGGGRRDRRARIDILPLMRPGTKAELVTGAPGLRKCDACIHTYPDLTEGRQPPMNV